MSFPRLTAVCQRGTTQAGLFSTWFRAGARDGLSSQFRGEVSR